jgi:hypothetical protein
MAEQELAVSETGENSSIAGGGQQFGASEIALIREVAVPYPGVSWKEPANTISESVELREFMGRGRERRPCRHGDRTRRVLVYALNSDALVRLRGRS